MGMDVWHDTAKCERVAGSFSRLLSIGWTFLDLFVISIAVRNFCRAVEQQGMCESAMRAWGSWVVASPRGLWRM